MRILFENVLMAASIIVRDAIEEVWEPHKETIRVWYLVENCSLKELTRRVNETCRIKSNPGQVVYQLGKWKFRKNLRRKDWAAVGQQVAKRKRDGKESEVCIGGLPINQKKVKKALTRYGTGSDQGIGALSIQSPEGVMVKSPRLATIVSTTAEHILTSPWPIPGLVQLTPLLACSLPFKLFVDKANVQAYLTTKIPDGGYLLTTTRMEELENAVITQLKPVLEQQEHPNSIFQDLKTYASEVQSNGTAHSQEVALKRTLLYADAMLKHILFLLSNNLPGSAKMVENYLWKINSPLQRKSFLKHFLSTEGPTSEALAEQLFILAIENNDLDTVQLLLGMGVNPNDLKCPNSGKTPLSLACSLHNAEIISALIDAGVNVDTECSNGTLKLADAISSCCSTSEADNGRSIATVQILLSSGAKLYPGPHDDCLMKAVAGGLEEMVDMLLTHGALSTSTSGDYLGSLLDECILGGGSSDHKISMIKRLVLAGAIPDTQSLVEAVRESQLDVVYFLLMSGAEVNHEVIEEAACDPHFDPDIFELILRYVYDDACPDSLSEALCAVIENDLGEFMEDLLTSNATLRRGHKLVNALEAAATRGDADIIHELLDAGSKHRAATIESAGRALIAAISHGHDDIANLLLENGVDVNHSVPQTGMSPLHAAIIRKNIKISEKLLAAGACVNQVLSKCTQRPCASVSMVSVLSAAVAWGYQPLIRNILNAGAEIDATGVGDYIEKTALTTAVENGNHVLMNLLISAGADINASQAELTEHTALAAAVQSGNADMVRLLLDLGADPTEPALIAAVSTRSEALQMLQSTKLARCRRLPRKFGARALQHAIRCSDLVAIKTLVNEGVNLDVMVRIVEEAPHWSRTFFTFGDRRSALGTALSCNQTENLRIIQLLLHEGADVNAIVSQSASCGRSYSALQIAIKYNDYSAVQTLIAAGANVNLRYNLRDCQTPLQIAAEQGSFSITKILLQNGADVNAVPHEQSGATALQLAVIYGSIEIVISLLEYGADVNAPPARFDGRTALEGAAEHGRVDFVQLLLSVGAQTTGPGETQYVRARQYAKENGHMAIWHLLEKHHNQQLDEMFDLGSLDLFFEQPTV